MSQTRSRLALLVVALLMSSASARSQVVTGLPPYGSFSGGPFDTVNNANLNVHFAVPVFAKAGRGLPFSYILTYDSAVLFPASVNGNLQWQPVSNWGWNGVTQVVTGYITYVTTPGFCFIHKNQVNFNVYSNFIYYDSLTTAHTFNLAVSSPTTCTGVPPNFGSAIATDGSGYTISASGGTSTASAHITTRSGQTINPPLNSSVGAGSAIDTNGNELTVSSGGATTFTDTLNTTALTVSGSPQSPPVSYQWTNPSSQPSTTTVNYTQEIVETNFACSGITDYGRTTQINQNLVTSINLPDGTSYTFIYEPTPNPVHSGAVTGRIASVSLPTGGTIRYQYSAGNSGITCADGSTATLTRTTPDGTWTYAHTESGTAWTTNITAPLDPQGNKPYTVLNFQGIYETERQTYPNQGGTRLATVDTCYNGSASPCTLTSVLLPITQRAVTATLPVPSGNLLSETKTNYNSYGLPTEVDEYAYGSGVVGALARKTLITYASLNNNIVDRPASIQVQNGGGSTMAQSTFVYDCNNPTNPCVTTTSGTPQHVSVSGSRGNLTTVTETTQGSSTISRTTSYYDTGTVSASTDFNSNTTTNTYGANSCGNSFVTSTTMPLSLSSSMTWNCTGGVLTQLTDPNSQSTNYGFGGAGDPNFWRVTSVTPPATTTTNMTYSATEIQSSLTNSTNGLTTTSTSVLDNLGRPKQAQLTGTSLSAAYVDTTPDALGRVATVSNPYYTTGDASYGKDTYAYDALGRITSSTHQDGNALQVAYGAAVATGGRSSQLCSTSSYGYGFPTLSTDEAGKMRQSWTDALGRLIEVDEPDPASGSLTSSAANGTCYLYDALGDLTEVDQGTQQTRRYTYDMLSRVLSVQTPESGTTYFYYANSGGGLCAGDPSAVCRRTDARSITTTYAYDALNRLTSKSYTNDPSSTPVANFFYSQSSVTIGSWSSGTLTYTLGRLTETCTSSTVGSCVSAKTATVYSYDAAGRVVNYWQCTPLNCGSSPWQMTYTYDSAGNPLTWTFPATSTSPNGFTVTNTYNAAMEITSISQYPSDLSNLPQDFAVSIGYTAFGAISTLLNGCAGATCTAHLETYDYNNRLQPVRIQLGKSGTPAANYCLVYNYYSGTTSTTCALPSSGSGNNGNVMGYYYQDSSNPSLQHKAAYTYDYLNRLTSSTGTPVSPGTVSYSLPFLYDRWGNMTCNTAGNPNGPCGNVAFSTSTNRITTIGSVSVSYDLAGNMTFDGTSTYTWDAEGRMIKAVQSSNTWQSTYNAVGDRVEFVAPTFTADLPADLAHQVLGSFNATGNLWWAQYVRVGSRIIAFNACCTNQTHFLHKDALGTTHMVTVADGSLQWDALVYPWGQAGWAGIGTDSDTGYAAFYGLDTTINAYPAPFRQYNPAQGRWLTPDPLAGDIKNPQSLNRYAYVKDSPTSAIDPLGLWDKNNHPPSCTTMNCAFQYFGGAMSPFYNNGADFTCFQDGAPTPCGSVMFALENGSVTQCPNNYCGTISVGGVLAYFSAHLTGSTYVPYAGPGSVFDTNDQAMIAGAMYAENQSLLGNGNEQCGMAYSAGDQFSYTAPVAGSVAGCQPLDTMGSISGGDIAAGGYHSHGQFDPNYESERFSGQPSDLPGTPGDIGWSTVTGLPLSVATPGGNAIVYYPGPGCQTFFLGGPAGSGTTTPICR